MSENIISTEGEFAPPIDQNNPFVWKDHKFIPRPWKLDVYLKNQEVMIEHVQTGLDMRGLFREQCKVLLKGVDPTSEQFLQQGRLAEAALSADEESDQIEAVRLMGVINFLHIASENRGERLQTSAPDLKRVIHKAQERMQPKATTPEESSSQKDTPIEQESYS
jgi:hypothetical protein